MRFSRRKRLPWLLVGIFLATLGLLGLIVLGIASNREALHSSVGGGRNAFTLQVPELDKQAELEEYWAKNGYFVGKRTIHSEQKSEQIERNTITWEQRYEEWTLIPSTHGLTLAEPLDQLVEKFGSEDIQVTLEQSKQGYSLNVYNSIPGVERQVLTYQWHFVEQNPLIEQAKLPNQEGADVLDIRDGAGTGDLTTRPQLALVIDDWGYNSIAVEPLLRFPYPLTVAVLPYLSSSRQIASRAASIGHEVILHQPMEPLSELEDPGEGVITIEMTEEEIHEQLLANIQHLPMISGVNNHMGSKATSSHDVMRSVLSFLGERELFFLDSYTTNLSVVREVATDLAVPYSVNHVFLDHVNDEEYIKSQLRRALRLAKMGGPIVAIGHVRSRTAAALWSMVPEIIESGVQLVPVSQALVRPQTELNEEEAF